MFFFSFFHFIFGRVKLERTQESFKMPSGYRYMCADLLLWLTEEISILSSTFPICLLPNQTEPSNTSSLCKRTRKEVQDHRHNFVCRLISHATMRGAKGRKER